MLTDLPPTFGVMHVRTCPMIDFVDVVGMSIRSRGSTVLSGNQQQSLYRCHRCDQALNVIIVELMPTALLPSDQLANDFGAHRSYHESTWPRAAQNRVSHLVAQRARCGDGECIYGSKAKDLCAYSDGIQFRQRRDCMQSTSRQVERWVAKVSGRSEASSSQRLLRRRTWRLWLPHGRTVTVTRPRQ